MAESVQNTDCFLSLKKLVLKDPMPQKYRPGTLSMLIGALASRAPQFHHLSKITLSKVGLDRNSLLPLSQLITKVESLNYLDICSNNFDAHTLSKLLAAIAGKNRLRVLNLSYNSA